MENCVRYDKNQYGFQHNASTDLAVSDMVSEIVNELDKGNYVAGIFIDLQKAFDTVNHVKLINKLERIGIRGVALELFKNYLHSRKICTKFGNSLSSYRYIFTGVPQGSVLGPTLYLIYIHDLQYNIDCSYKVFADDTCLLLSNKNPVILQNMVSEKLNEYINWLKANKLLINASKTKFMIFKNVNMQGIRLNLTIDNECLEEVQVIKYLGVMIDNKLSWLPQIERIMKKIVPLMGRLKRIRSKFNKRIINILYHSHILGTIRYCMNTWSMCPEYAKSKVEKLMKKALKILHKLEPRTESELVFRMADQLNLHTLIFIEKAKLIYKILHNQAKNNFNIVRRNQVTSVTTRQSHSLHIPTSRTDKHKYGTVVTSLKIFNSLPSEIREIPNLKKFQSKLKTFAKENQMIVKNYVKRQ